MDASALTRVQVLVPKGQVEAVSRALRISQRVIAANLEHNCRQHRRSAVPGLGEAQIAELTNLLEQLSGCEDRDAVLTGQFEPLRAAASDALISASHQLAAAAYGYWHCGASFRAIERQVATVQGGAALLRSLEDAKTSATSRPPTLM